MGDFMYGEVIECENGTKGRALNLEQDSVGAVVLGDYLDLVEGQKALCTGKVLEVPVGEAMPGRVVNTLGTPIDGKGEIKAESSSPVEVFVASKPSQEAQSSIEEKLQIKYGNAAKITFSEDPKMMGGLAIKVGDETLDLSIRGKVTKLVNQLNF